MTRWRGGCLRFLSPLAAALLTGAWLIQYRQISQCPCSDDQFDPARAQLLQHVTAQPEISLPEHQLVETFHPSIARDFSPWLAKAIRRPAPEKCQLILLRNGSDVRYLNAKSLPDSLRNKASAFDTHLQWVMQRLPPGHGRPTSMCVHLGSTPVHPKSQERAYPTYSLAKSDDHLDIVYPNMYFGYGGSIDNWNDFQAELMREAMKHPYHLRRDQAFWRGTCGGYRYNIGRMRLVLAGRNDTRLDVGFSNPCPMGDSKDGADVATIEAVNALPTTKFIRPLGMTEYKYLFSMPGSSKGSYSRHLQTALCSNSTVLLWDNDFYEFYYSSLTAWEHFVPVSDATLQERLKWLITHPAEAERIARNGHHFCMTQLTGPAIVSYWLQLFTMHSLLQAYDVEAEEATHACTCIDLQNVLKCDFCSKASV